MATATQNIVNVEQYRDLISEINDVMRSLSSCATRDEQEREASRMVRLLDAFRPVKCIRATENDRRKVGQMFINAHEILVRLNLTGVSR